MAQLKDLIVNGATRLIGDAYVNNIQITKLNAPTSAGGSTYGAGSENQVLLSNGSSIYWGKANISSFTNDAGYITSADVPEGASAYTGTISAVGTTASTGTDNGFARGDHVHNITKATIDNTLGTGTGNTKFYREDGTWATPDYITNTDEKLKIAAVTSGTTYYPIVATNSTAAANRQYDATGFAYVGINGTTSAVGAAKITLGNSTASGTANNKQGSIVLYGSTAYATTITPGAPSAARTITLPNGSGTIALSSNPIIKADSGTAAVSLTANTTYKLTAGGGSLIFKTPVDTNTDTKVTQAYSTTNDSYPLLLSATNGVTSTGSRGDTTSILNNQIYANPNTGTLSTTKLVTSDTSSVKNLIITNTGPDFGIQFLRTGTSISNAPNYIQFPASSRLNFIGQDTLGNAASMMILESDPTNPSIFPGTTDTVNLGTTSLKWNNIYTKTVTLSQDPVNNLEAATKQYVDNAFTVNDAMLFKGVVNANGDLPTTHKQGWTYKVGTAGTYAGKTCEVGDTIYCVTDGTAANNNHWVVVQANVDAPLYKDGNTFAGSKILLSDGTGGKVKEGTTVGAADLPIYLNNGVPTAINYTIAKSVPNDAKFTDTVTTVTTSGSGNAITAISASNGAITATKGSTFLTSHQDISGKADKSATVSTVAWDSTNKKITKTINGTTSDVVQFVANGGVTLTGESGKLTISSSESSTAFEIPVLFSSGWYIPSTIKGTDILNHIDNCYLMIDGYGRTEINNYLIDSASPPGPNIQLFAKAYDDVYYFGTEYTMFKVIAAGNSTNTPTVETIDFTQQIQGEDKRVNQNYSTTNASYPLLLTSTSGITSTSSRGATEAILNNNMYANPSTGTITATTFSGALSGNATTATTATKLGTANKGSGTKPIYLAAGVPTECSTYAGGTAVTLNGASKAASTASFYAPTSAGTSGQLLKSNGSGAPGWMTTGVGSSMQPIYFSAGVPIACAIPSNGAWWSAVPQILQDGVMEVGKYIDFHTASNGTTDYDVRITAETTGLTISGTTVGTFSGNLNGNASTATTATKLGTDTKGSSTKPIYLSSGAPTECSTYAGGTKVTLNGSNKGASTASFYAPTSVGTSGYILKSNGSGAPTWLQTLPVANGGTGATSAADAPWVQKSGDTMTGYLTYKDSTIDASKANNNVSADNYPTTFNITDSANRIISRQEAVVSANGNIAGFWYVRNYNTSGESLGTQGIQIIMNKSGELTTEIRNSKKLTIDKNSCIQRNAISSSWLTGRANALTYLNTSDGYSTLASIKTTNGTWSIGHYTSWANSLLWIYIADSRTENNYDARAYLTSAGEYHANKVWGAVYNDYAEMRNVPAAQIEDSPLRPGTCVREVGDGTMIPTTERLQRGCKIISDTFGFNIGETEDCKTPIAVSGRALVYLDQDREIARDYIGWPVCSGPNGTVSIMTEEEEEKYPSRIIGTISEIPDYEKWGSSDVEVNGRIWIYVR